jgi:aspartate/methionine/tyrosine aminotransferase
VGAAAPLQQASAIALGTGQYYYEHLASDYLGRRNMLLKTLTEAGFGCYSPAGAYYVMADIPNFHSTNDREFARQLIENNGVAAVPGSSFYENCGDAGKIRFCFCKSYETLKEAGRRLGRLRI